MDHPVSEKQQMLLIDPLIPIIYCGITGRCRTRTALPSLFMKMPVAFLQNISVIFRRRGFGFFLHPIIKKVDCNVSGTGRGNGMSRKINIMYGYVEA